MNTWFILIAFWERCQLRTESLVQLLIKYAHAAMLYSSDTRLEPLRTFTAIFNSLCLFISISFSLSSACHYSDIYFFILYNTIIINSNKYLDVSRRVSWCSEILCNKSFPDRPCNVCRCPFRLCCGSPRILYRNNKINIYFIIQ